MPSKKTHCAISQQRTDFAFGKLHDWIDEGAKTTGVDHRKERHHFNLADKKAIKDYWDKAKGKGWGEKAVIEWLFHIALDNMDTSYKMSLKSRSYGRNTYNCIKIHLHPNGFINCTFTRER